LLFGEGSICLVTASRNGTCFTDQLSLAAFVPELPKATRSTQASKALIGGIVSGGRSPEVLKNSTLASRPALLTCRSSEHKSLKSSDLCQSEFALPPHKMYLNSPPIQMRSGGS
jgi:hypothetical protein